MILVKHNNEGNYKPFFYFALEDYLLNTVLKDGESYFFTWVIKGVVIGKNQIIENEVNIDYLKAHNINLFRRPTGGGTVYADENNTMFSIITKKRQDFSFKKELQPLVDAVAKLGVNLEFSGRNDVLYQGKKVSGNAFLQNKNGMLLHGTLLYDCDLETMIRAITPDDEKLVSKGIESVRSRVTNLKPYLKGLSQEQLINHIESDMTDRVYVLSKAEIAMLEESAKKWESKQFLYHQTATYTKTLSKRLSGGKVTLSILLKEGVIEKINIEGDFFELKDVGEYAYLLEGKEYNKDVLDKLLDKETFNEYFLDMRFEEFKHLLYSGILE